ncbi:hypothetical protein, partial [Puniceibacterium antarcticum]|uniref:hypothetical protein n=1 Tax=Puniceibacterium antarcticum TaxID=1206336 RepID=UPI0015D4BD3F
AETIEAVTDAFLRLGLSNFILITFVGLVVWAVIKGRIRGATAEDAFAEAVTPISCMWADADRRELREVTERLERIERDLAILKDRRA